MNILQSNYKIKEELILRFMEFLILKEQVKIDGTEAILTRAIPSFMGIKVVNEKMYDKITFYFKISEINF